jgi:SAM-dependent methyltransferase
MPSGTVAPFTLADLAVFDATRLRAVIGRVSGAVSPALIGRALGREDARDDAAARGAYDGVAECIARALTPDDRSAFERARHQAAPTSERERAAHAVLSRLFWELTYWKTPAEYEQLTAGEQVHLGALDVAWVDGAVVLDAGAGCGRVTLPMARRARTVYALDPAPPMLALLERKLAATGLCNVELLRGGFQRVPLSNNSVDAVIACSAFGPLEARGVQRGRDELRRVTRPGGRIVIMWPEDPA